MSKPCVFPEQDINELVQLNPTPFHLYDETVIRKQCKNLKDAFSWRPGFRNYFAVKATPNPNILKIVKEENSGADCSSLAELLLAESAGFKGDEIMFTSNDTPAHEYSEAKRLGAIINIDDYSHIQFLADTHGLPELLCFRYNPGNLRRGNQIIGDPAASKFGITTEQLPKCFEKCIEIGGVKEFGLHTMIVSNCLDLEELVETAKMMFELASKIKEEHQIKLKFVNLGGGIGIPYKLTETAVDVQQLGQRVSTLYQQILVPAGLDGLNVVYECGRYITGPAGSLVTQVIHQKDIYKPYLGVDACINSLMRPALYGSYHHITVAKKPSSQSFPNLPKATNIFSKKYSADTLEHSVDVVGSLCENNDKLAVDRNLPVDINIGDYLIFHDTGAHGHAMGFNYNGKLRSAEYLLLESAEPEAIMLQSGHYFKQIRRAETLSDYFSTLCWSKSIVKASSCKLKCIENLQPVIFAFAAGLLFSCTACWTIKKCKNNICNKA